MFLNFQEQRKANGPGQGGRANDAADTWDNDEGVLCVVLFFKKLFFGPRVIFQVLPGGGPGSQMELQKFPEFLILQFKIFL